jgi:hypothetical protein
MNTGNNNSKLMRKKVKIYKINKFIKEKRMIHQNQSDLL